MEEKQSVNTYNHFREVAIIEPIETVAKEGWVKWGVDNLYPQFLWSLYVNSPIHGGIINSKNTFISGAGLKYEGAENWDEINKNGRSKHTLDELVEMYSLDQEVVNGYYIRCVYDALNEMWQLEHLDFELMRPNENGTLFYYSENWSTNKQNEKTKFKTYTSFFNRTSETKECVLFVKAKSRQFVLETKKLTAGHYPIPLYSGGIDAILTDVEINFFRLSEVVNGYKGGTLISLNNGIPESEEQADKIVDDLKLNATDKRKQGGVSVTFSDGKDREPSIVQLNGNDLDKRYESTEVGLSKKIFIAHSVINPKMFGYIQDSSLFSSDLEKDFNIFSQTYIAKRQKNIADSLNFVLSELNGMTGTISFNEYKLQIENQIDETNAVSKALNSMSPLVANKVLSSLTSNEIRALAKLAPIEGGDTIPTATATFSAEDNETQILDLFSSCGRSKNEVKIIKSEEFSNQTDEQIIEGFFKDKFAVTDNQNLILSMLSNGESYDAIVKALDMKPIEVSKIIIGLQSKGLLDGGKVTDIGLQEIIQKDEISVVYSYEKRPNAPDLVKGGKSRDFCATLIRLDKVYTREEINMISTAVNRDVWSYRGGWYHNPNTDINTPSCRHFWKQNVIYK
jgi:hypothetical protein